ncbi:MAG: nucleotidyltransferase domain-containing protein [Candidatus Bathyarchaeia archaeon]
MVTELKSKVAREAATQLYFGAEREYKQAKTRAAHTLGTHFLPSNLEVALELDKIAEENEGENRKERLVEMRKEALNVMKLLDAYCPILIGSVWRGTIHRGSDIDIAAYSDDPQEIVTIIKAQGIRLLKTAWTTVNKHGRTLASLNVQAETPAKYGLEIVIRATEEKGEKRKCEIFGDEIKGLKTKNLERLLRDNPTQRFIPS